MIIHNGIDHSPKVHFGFNRQFLLPKSSLYISTRRVQIKASNHSLTINKGNSKHMALDWDNPQQKQYEVLETGQPQLPPSSRPAPMKPSSSSAASSNSRRQGLHQQQQQQHSMKLMHFDGLRGLASLLVVFLHTFLKKEWKYILEMVKLWQPFGWMVPVFFILSGRVLLMSSLKKLYPSENFEVIHSSFNYFTSTKNGSSSKSTYASLPTATKNNNQPPSLVGEVREVANQNTSTSSPTTEVQPFKADMGAAYNSLASALFRRPFRLILPIVAYVFLTLFISVTTGFYGKDANKFVVKNLWELFINPWFFIMVNGAVDWKRNTIPGPVWTIAIEWMGSLNIYLAALLMIRFHARPITVLAIISFLGLFSFICDSWSSHFFYGLFLAQAHACGLTAYVASFKHTRTVNLLMFLFSLVLFLEGPSGTPFFGKQINSFFNNYIIVNQKGDFVGDDRESWGYWLPNGCRFLGSAAFMTFLELEPQVQKILAGPVFLYLGKISFSLYIIHGLYWDIWGWWILDKFIDKFDSHAVRTLLFLFGLVLVLWPVAHLFYYYVEMPSVTIVRKLESFLMTFEGSIYTGVWNRRRISKKKEADLLEMNELMSNSTGSYKYK